MKKQLCVFSCLVLFACNNYSQKIEQQKQVDIIVESGGKPVHADTSHIERDSIAFLRLIIGILKWDKDDTIRSAVDFRLMQKNPTDTFFSGLDWKNYYLRVKELDKTGFFSKKFMDNYHNIAISIDNKLKQSKTKCLTGMQSYEDWDEFCNCQCFPEEGIEKSITITNIKAYNDSATFQWIWDSSFDADKEKHTVKTEKEDNTWKISYMDSFTTKIFTPDF